MQKKQFFEDEAFAFERTVSRILEMQSEAYLEAHEALVARRGGEAREGEPFEPVT